MKNRVLLEVFGRSKVAYEGLSPQSRSNSTKNGRAKQDSIGRVGFPSPAYQSLYFPFFSGIRARGGRLVFTRVEAKATRCLPGDTAEFAEGWRNAIPLGIRRAYTFSRKRCREILRGNK